MCSHLENICKNLKYASENLKIPNISYNHPAFSNQGATFKRIVNDVQEKVDYSEKSSPEKNI